MTGYITLLGFDKLYFVLLPYGILGPRDKHTDLNLTKVKPPPHPPHKSPNEIFTCNIFNGSCYIVLRIRIPIPGFPKYWGFMAAAQNMPDTVPFIM